MCPQIKLSKPVFQHVPANETYPSYNHHRDLEIIWMFVKFSVFIIFPKDSVRANQRDEQSGGNIRAYFQT
jgi:hypothetical protein